MVLCNLATSDWVVEPNFLGMGTFPSADLMTPKPYVSGAPTSTCRFDPGKDCPITALYRAFLDRNRERLAGATRGCESLAPRSSGGIPSADALIARLSLPSWTG